MRDKVVISLTFERPGAYIVDLRYIGLIHIVNKIEREREMVAQESTTLPVSSANDSNRIVDHNNSIATGEKKSTRHLTRIFGDFYDVTHFDHPGGQTALSLCVGRDASELFHTSHQFVNPDKLKLVLAKYRITDVTDEEMKAIPEHGIFDWKETLESDFYKELRQLVDPIFEKYGTKANAFRYTEMLVLFLFLTSQYYYFVKGDWFSVFTFPLALWLFAVNVAHDASHFAISRQAWINDVFMEMMNFNTSTYYWYHQHIIGHHNFPNVYRKDPDIHVVQIFRHHKEEELRPVNRFQHWYFPFIYPLRFPIAYAMTTYRLFVAKDFYGILPLIPFNQLHDKLWMVVRVSTVLIFMHVLPFFYHGLTTKGVIFAFVPFALFSIHSMICTAFNHQHPNCDEQFSKNFYIHQVITGHSVASDGFKYFNFLYTGGLNYQLEHHLFPTVNHTHLWRIRPIIQSLCKKYDIPYNMSPNLFVAMKGLFDHMKKMSTLTSPTTAKRTMTVADSTTAQQSKKVN